MPTLISTKGGMRCCKQCGKAFSPQRPTNRGPLPIYCRECSTPKEANRRAHAKRLMRANDLESNSFKCWKCGKPSEDSTLYPLCSTSCQDALIPFLAKRLEVSEKLVKLGQRHGLFTHLASPDFSEQDARDFLSSVSK